MAPEYMESLMYQGFDLPTHVAAEVQTHELFNILQTWRKAREEFNRLTLYYIKIRDY